MTKEFPDKLRSKIRLSRKMIRMFSPSSGICVELPIEELFIFTSENLALHFKSKIEKEKTKVVTKQSPAFKNRKERNGESGPATAGNQTKCYSAVLWSTKTCYF